MYFFFYGVNLIVGHGIGANGSHGDAVVHSMDGCWSLSGILEQWSNILRFLLLLHLLSTGQLDHYLCLHCGGDHIYLFWTFVGIYYFNRRYNTILANVVDVIHYANDYYRHYCVSYWRYINIYRY